LADWKLIKKDEYLAGGIQEMGSSGGIHGPDPDAADSKPPGRDTGRSSTL